MAIIIVIMIVIMTTIISSPAQDCCNGCGRGLIACRFATQMGVSINGDPPKWIEMDGNGKLY